MQQIKVIIPAYNEQDSIGLVVKDIPQIVDEIIVVNNNSSDNTVEVARDAGATVLTEKRGGYGYACLKGIDYIKELEIKPDIVVFLDGDYSDYPEEINKIIEPICKNQVDFVIGSRVKSLRENGSMTPQQVFGNKLACFLMQVSQFETVR